MPTSGRPGIGERANLIGLGTDEQDFRASADEARGNLADVLFDPAHLDTIDEEGYPAPGPFPGIPCEVGGPTPCRVLDGHECSELPSQLTHFLSVIVGAV